MTPHDADLPAVHAGLDSEVVLDHVQSFAHVGFWDFDLRTEQLYLSTQVFEILGINAPSIEEYLDIVHPDDLHVLRQVYRRARQQAGPYRVRHRTADDRRLLQVHVQSVASQGATPTRLLGVISDVTVEWQLERALEQSTAARLTGLLAGGAIHDLKNIFTVLLGHTQLVRAALDRGVTPEGESLAALERAANNGIELTTQLLQVGHRDPLGVQPVDVDELFARLEATARTALGRERQVVVDAGPGGVAVLADESRLERAIVDLLLNARDALPPGGGTVQLRFSALDEQAATARAAEHGLPPGSYGTIEVTDDGAGMDDEVLARVTDPFFTTKGQQGTGVGLHAVARFVEGAGGALSIASRRDLGTTAELLLPMAASTGASGRRGHEAVRVLVHGRDEDGCEVLATVLADAGIQSVVATSSWTATNVLRTEPIDLLVTDADVSGDAAASTMLRVAASNSTAVLSMEPGDEVETVVESARRLLGRERQRVRG